MRCAGEALADSMFRVNPPTRTVRVFKPTVPEGWFVKEFGDVNWYQNNGHDEDEGDATVVPDRGRWSPDNHFVVLEFLEATNRRVRVPRTQDALARFIADHSFVCFEETDGLDELMEGDDDLSLCQETASTSFIQVQNTNDPQGDEDARSTSTTPRLIPTTLDRAAAKTTR